MAPATAGENGGHHQAHKQKRNIFEIRELGEHKSQEARLTQFYRLPQQVFTKLPWI